MKKNFYCSLCGCGVHGGALRLTDEYLYFRCKKVSIPEEFKTIKIQYDNIKKISVRKFGLIFPIIKIFLQDNRTYSFLVFNNRKFIKIVKGKGINVIQNLTTTG